MSLWKKTPHPLRPKEKFILICEGESDHTLIAELFKPFPIFVVWAEGGKNLGALTSIFSPAVYIQDRDFEMSVSEAELTFSLKKPKTCWVRFDFESYLLHQDWLLNACQLLQPVYPSQIFPNTEQQIEQNLLDIAQDLVVYHAGRQTLQTLSLHAKTAIKDRGAIQSNKASDWENHLKSELALYLAAGQQLASFETETHLINLFYQNLHDYGVWASSLDSLQLHFSGKIILRELANRWQTNTGRKYGWELLRKLIIEQILIYAKTIQGNLSDDPRLGDFGLLASKILGRKI